LLTTRIHHALDLLETDLNGDFPAS